MTHKTAYEYTVCVEFKCVHFQSSRRELQPINFGHYRTRPRFSVCNYAMEYSQLLPVLSVNDTYMRSEERRREREVILLGRVKSEGNSTNQFWSISEATKIFGL